MVARCFNVLIVARPILIELAAAVRNVVEWTAKNVISETKRTYLTISNILAIHVNHVPGVIYTRKPV